MPSPQDSAVSRGQSQSQAIAKTNVLEKLCFVAFDGPISKYKFQLRAALYEYHQFSGHKSISRQTIQYWFDKGSHPSRQGAFEFLLDYLSKTINYDILTEDQKKVYTQLAAYLRNSLRSIPNSADRYLESEERAYVSKNDRIVLNIPGANERILKIADSLIGTYKTYRMRGSGNKIAPVAREVLWVYRRQRSLHFEHWYLKDGHKLEKFDGILMSVGDTIWFIGFPQNPVDQMRIMHFLDTPYSEYRWGLMTSSLSGHSSHDPSSCRIFLRKIHDKIENLVRYSREVVKHISFDEKSEVHMNIIQRLIENNVTAMSYADSIVPAKMVDGNDVKDSTFRVNHLTLQEAIQQMS
jgi:hypothetical protein